MNNFSRHFIKVFNLYICILSGIFCLYIHTIKSTLQSGACRLIMRHVPGRNWKILKFVSMALFITGIIGFSGCGNTKSGNKLSDSENIYLEVKTPYNDKRHEYYVSDEVYFGEYEFVSRGTYYGKVIEYPAIEGDGILKGYTGRFVLRSGKEKAVDEAELLRYAEIEFMQYMDGGFDDYMVCDNIVQMECIIKGGGKNNEDASLVLRFADEKRTKVVQYIENGGDGGYKEVDNSYIDSVEADSGSQGVRYFASLKSQDNLILKEINTNDLMSGTVNRVDVTIVEDYTREDIILIAKRIADVCYKREKDITRDYSYLGLYISMERNAENIYKVCVVYGDDGYRLFEFSEDFDELEEDKILEGEYITE